MCFLFFLFPRNSGETFIYFFYIYIYTKYGVYININIVYFKRKQVQKIPSLLSADAGIFYIDSLAHLSWLKPSLGYSWKGGQSNNGPIGGRKHCSRWWSGFAGISCWPAWAGAPQTGSSSTLVFEVDTYIYIERERERYGVYIYVWNMIYIYIPCSLFLGCIACSSDASLFLGC